ncbi:MAG: pilin [Candidatus Magasanikbacteria bacterium]|nr:pilin [Candidatus Magasanikbacteria bacterium]
MKKLFIITVAVLGGFFLLSTQVFAAPDIGFQQGGMAQGIANQSGYDTSGDQYALSRTIGGIIRGVLSLIGVIFLVLTIYAGLLWMTASGAEEKITKAKGIIKSSVIGLAIVASAYGITALVMNFVIGASAPSTDSSQWGPETSMGCCYWEAEKKCMQTTSAATCGQKWADAQWFAGESCTPYFNCAGGIDY